MPRSVKHRIILSIPIFLAVLVNGRPVFAQAADLVPLAQLEASIAEERTRIQVINFWATWCAPCLKELPLFEKLNDDRKDVRVLLVSLDMDLDPNPDKVRNFAARKKLKSEVIILNEKDPNSWINRIEKTWSGAIPATLIINNRTGKRKFVEKELKTGDLERLLLEVQ
jgi:thiol-disulfide isomerase/thioredoxin